MINIVKLVNCASYDTREMEFGSLGDGVDGEHKDVGFVEISNRFLTQDTFSFETKSFTKLQ